MTTEAKNAFKTTMSCALEITNAIKTTHKTNENHVDINWQKVAIELSKKLTLEKNKNNKNIKSDIFWKKAAGLID